jgi:23S rRNA pseudouridine1911/1915/1917 synthase
MKEPTVIYVANDFLAVDKPAGLVVHPPKISSERKRARVNEPTLVDWLLERYPEIQTVGDFSTSVGQALERPGIVHRLDKDTSGVMLVARTQEYFEYLKGLFQKRLIKKNYLALVFGEVKEKQGIISAPIGMKNSTMKRTTQSTKFTKEAITEYSLIRVIQAPLMEGKTGLFSLLSVFPKTGRTHQIRVHLASIHHPVVGDRLYGPRAQPPWATRLMLHALSLELTLKTGERIKIEDEAPPEFRYGE